MNDYHNIQQLITLFFEGNTSLEEEQELYNFYSCHKDLPAEMEQYREIFAAFDAITVDEPTLRQSIDANTPTNNKGKQRRHKTLLYTIGSIAATILIYIGVNTAIHAHEDHLLAKTYEGSYVIINGKRINDLSRIKPEIERALSQAKTIESNLPENTFIHEAEQNILNNTGSAEEKARIEQLLNE